jgi:phage shock protein PspC (stress-responsive transcriptional regulator)
MRKRLVKSKDRVIAGVCGGIAEYFGFDYTLTRLIYALLTISTAFAGGLVYIILWIIMPDR